MSSEFSDYSLSIKARLEDYQYVFRSLCLATTVDSNEAIYKVPLKAEKGSERVIIGSSYYAVRNAYENMPIEQVIQFPRIGSIVFEKGLFLISYSSRYVNPDEMNMQKVDLRMIRLRAQDRRN